MARVGATISYCSNERAFLKAIIYQLGLAGISNVAVAYGSHLYDGTPEPDVPESLKSEFPLVSWCRYEVDLSKDMSKMPGVVRRPSAYWHNLARSTAVAALGDSVDWVLLLDSDEVPDGLSLRAWLDATALNTDSAYKLANYWYFKEATWQALTLEDSVLLVPRRVLNDSTIYNDYERDDILRVSGIRCERSVKGMDGAPMFHHYSWVRGREGLTTKLRTWAHRDDMFMGVSVEKLIEYVYMNDSPNDVVHNYEYRNVDKVFCFETGKKL